MSSFSKSPKSYVEQLEILRSRGLSTPDPAFALHCLKHLNYYRLSAYRYTLLSPGNHEEFRAGATFTDLWRLYDFDQTLRRIVIDASKRVEVSVRSRWAYVLAHRHGAFAYEDSSLFRSVAGHAEMIRILDEELSRSSEEFVLHFARQHGLSRPPIWAACEVFSFGLTSRFFKSLRRSADRLEVSRTYGLDDRVLSSFLHHLSTVRNHAAHHGRLWNRSFTVAMAPPRYPHGLATNFVHNPNTAERRIYNTMTMLLHLLAVIDPASHIPAQLYEVLDSADPACADHMGFPSDWRTRALWQAAASQRTN